MVCHWVSVFLLSFSYFLTSCSALDAGKKVATTIIKEEIRDDIAQDVQQTVRRSVESDYLDLLNRQRSLSRQIDDLRREYKEAMERIKYIMGQVETKSRIDQHLRRRVKSFERALEKIEEKMGENQKPLF